MKGSTKRGLIEDGQSLSMTDYQWQLPANGLGTERSSRLPSDLVDTVDPVAERRQMASTNGLQALRRRGRQTAPATSSRSDQADVISKSKKRQISMEGFVHDADRDTGELAKDIRPTTEEYHCIFPQLFGQWLARVIGFRYYPAL